VAVTPSGPEPPSPTTPAVAASLHRTPSPDPVAVSVSELAEATRTVLAVAGALARYTVLLRTRGPKTAVHLLRPVPTRLARAAVGRTAGVVLSAGRVATGVVGGLADVLLPDAARAALSRVDVTALVLEFVDLDRLAAALDVDAVVARVDLAAVVDRIDVEAIAAGLDLDALVEKVDIARVLDRVDLDDVVGRVDLDGVVARVDLDRAVDRVDLDRVIARADVLQLVRWVVQEIDLPALIRTSSGSVAAEMVRGVRDQSADADRAVDRVVDRLLRRSGGRS